MTVANDDDVTDPVSFRPLLNRTPTLKTIVGDTPWVPPATDQRIVYGVDDRLDVFEVANPFRLTQAASTCALISNDQLTSNGDGTYSIRLFAYTQGGVMSCDTEPFASQPVAAFCSGFMVGNNLIATAGHCIGGETDLGNFSFVFGFNMLNASTPVSVVNENQIYSGTQLLSWEPGGDHDHALVRVDRNINSPGAIALPVRTSGTISSTQTVGVTGHPSGLPMKIAFGGQTRVRSNSDPAFFGANIDGLPGNSGSPVFNSTTGEVEGILVRGPASNFLLAGGCFVERVVSDTFPLLVEVTRISVLTAGVAPSDPALSISLHEASLTGGDTAVYNEILGHFSDAVFEATEGVHDIDRVRVRLDGQPVFDEFPVITVLGPNPLYVQPNTAYVDPGATALDAEDGNLTAAMVTQIGVNTSVADYYFVRYRVTDSDQHSTEAFRLVKVVGNDPRVFVIPGVGVTDSGNPLYVAQDSLYIDAGAFRTDITDGFGFLIATSNNVNTADEGEYAVTYSYTDFNGNTSTATRVVRVIADNFDEPIIELFGQNPVWLNAGQGFSDPGAIATDATDGPLPILTTGGVNTGGEGTYFITYTARDTAGNETTAQRVVHVQGQDPVLNTLGPNPITLPVGNVFIDPGAVATDVTGGVLTDLIAVDNPVNPMVPGQYFVLYAVTDGSGHLSEAFRQVNVVGSFDDMPRTDIVWLPRGVPSLPKAGGLGTQGGHIAMYDVFAGGQAGADLDFLGSVEGRRQAGYVLAGLWLQYHLGLGAEFAERSSDVAVVNSILADPFSPAFATNGTGLNVSSTQDGVAAGGAFQELEHTGATPQHRLHGLSAWATIEGQYGGDAKPARLIAKRPRSFFPELAAVAPAGTADPALDLGSIPTGPFGASTYFDNRQQFFRIGTENSLPISSGEPAQTSLSCVRGRLVNITVSSPVTYEFPVDSDVRELMVAINSPCLRDLVNLETVLTDPLGRRINPVSVEDVPGLIQYRIVPSVPGTWSLQLIARLFTVEAVQVDVYGKSVAPTHRLGVSIPTAPGKSATSSIAYPGPLVLLVSDSSGLTIRGAEVEGWLTIPTGSRFPVTFSDDGSGADMLANDGMYTLTMPYGQGGNYLLEVSAFDLSGNQARYTATGTSRAPTEGFLGAEATPVPLDQPVGEPYMRSIFYSFSVIGYRADDHGDTALTATTLPLTNDDLPGRIDSVTDVDFYRIQVTARGAANPIVGRMTHLSEDARLRLRLLAANGFTELARAERGPAGYMMIMGDLAAGTYFLEVTSTSTTAGATYSVSAGSPVPSDLENVGVDAESGGGRGGGGGGGGCFIATAAYGTPLDAEIGALRAARDGYLLTNGAGAAFSDVYYRLSPPIADWVAQNAAARDAVRGMLYLVLHPVWLLMAMIALGAAGTVTRGLVMRRVRR